MKKQETRSKKKKKLNRKKWKGNLFTIEIGALSKINKKEGENYKQEKLEGDLTFTLSIFFIDSK